MDRPIRVLTLTPFYPSSEDDAYGCFVSEPLEHLSGFDVISPVVAVQPFYQESIKPNSGAPNATWIRYPRLPHNVGLASAGRMLYARLRLGLHSLLRESSIDIIHAHGALPCGQAAAMLSRDLGIPYVVSVHGLDAFSTRQVNGFSGRWCERASRSVFQKASRVICVSELVRSQIVYAMGESAKTAVVYNGVDTDLFAPARDGAEVDGMTVLSVGNLIPIKGHELVIRKVASLAREHPTLRYEIIGDGPEHARLAALASELKIAERVLFLGRRSRRDVAEAMRRCTVFALPSRYEGLGCVYLEAMASAKPVIACRGQGIEEIIRHQENGWLIMPDSLEEMSAALSSLFKDSNLRERLGREGRRTVIEGLTLAHQADRLSQVYRECLH